MISAAFCGSNAIYITYRGANHLEFSEIKLKGKIRKLKKNGMSKFFTIGVLWYFNSLLCHFDITAVLVLD